MTEKQTVWVVASLSSEGHLREISGVYSTRELAFAAITDDHSAAAEFEIDRDYTLETAFTMITRANPEPFVSDTKEPGEILE